jgi:hypothetical protein
LGAEDRGACIGCVGSQAGSGEQKEYEIMLVTVSNTVVDKYAVVIEFRDATLADAAMF